MTATFKHDTDRLLDRALAGDKTATTSLLGQHRARLRKLVAVRLDSRLTARVDPSDVIQEALIDANRQLEQYAAERSVPFYPWLRQITLSRLAQVHRFHLQSQRRSVRRERDEMEVLDQSAAALARQFAARIQSPSEIARENEDRLRLQEAIQKLSPVDREVLVLRYVEQLSTSDAAAVLNVTENGFAQKHLRAVRRLRAIVHGEGRS